MNQSIYTVSLYVLLLLLTSVGICEGTSDGSFEGKRVGADDGAILGLTVGDGLMVND